MSYTGGCGSIPVSCPEGLFIGEEYHLGNDAVRFFFHSSPGKYFKLPVALMAYGFIKPFYFRACNFENIITVRGTVTIFIGCPPGSADGSYIVFDNTGFDFMVGIQVGMP